MALPDREIAICHRLRAFREATKISRAKFALTIGIGSERLASYESARAPVRYELYLAVNLHFLINPIWLATGEGAAETGEVINASGLPLPINPRDLFSKVYDEHLAQITERAHKSASEQWFNLLGFLKAGVNDPDITDFFKDNPDMAKKMIGVLDRLSERLKQQDSFSAKANKSLNKIRKRA